MNPDFPQNERARLEAKLTALLLGELHADEIAALSEAMEQDPELAALYERLKVTVELVREGAAQPKAEEQARLKLSAEKREKLLASFKTVAPKEFAKPRRVMDWLVPMAACVAIVGVLAAMLLPSLSGAKRKEMRKGYWGDKMAGAHSSSQGQIVQNQAAALDYAIATPSTPTTVTTTRGRQGEFEHITPDVPKGESRSAGGVRVPAPARETVASTPGFQAVFAPAATPSTAATPAPIVLPPKQEDAGVQPGQTVADSFDQNKVTLNYAVSGDVSGALKQLGSQRTNELALNQQFSRETPADRTRQNFQNFTEFGLGTVAASIAVVTNGIAPGAVVFNADSFDTKNSYRELSKLGADFENKTITLNYKNVTNGIVGAQTWAADTHNQVGNVMVDPDSHHLILSADAETTEQVQRIIQNLDRRGGNAQAGVSNTKADDKVPVIGDVSLLGRLFKSNSTVAQNGDFRFQLGYTREDLDGLRYQATNAVVASRSLDEGALAWGASDGTTNATVLADAGNFPNLSGANTFGNGTTVNNGTLTLGAAVTGSSEVARQAYIAAPSASDGLLTSGLRAHGAEIVQAENRKSEIVLPSAQNSALTTRMTTSIALSDAGSFGGNGGFGGGGGGGGGGFGGGANQNSVLMQREQQASGGKQAEFPSGVTEFGSGAGFGGGQSRLETATVKVDPNTLYRSLQNVGGINFGAATNNAPSETPSTPSFAGVGSTESGGGRGLRYVTGIEPPQTEKQLAVKNFLQAAGVNLDSTNGKSVFYNERQGTLTVRGTDEDLNKIQTALNTLNAPKPDVAINAKFAEASSNDSQTPDARDVTSMGRRVQVEKGWSDKDASANLPALQPARSTNWWNARATVSGFYDEHEEATIATTNRFTEYASAKEELDTAKKLRVALDMKTAQESTDENLPRGRMVTVMDRATPAATEKPTLGQKIKESFTGKVERTASVQVSADRLDIGGIGTPGSLDSGYDPYFLQTEFETIQSDAVLSRVVDKLNLDGGDKSKRQAAEAQLKKSLDLRQVKNTKFIEIGATSEKPDDAARIANAVAEAYGEYRSQQYEDLKHHGIKSLQEQAAEQDKKIQLAQARVDELRKGLGVPDSAANTAASELMDPNRLKEVTSLLVQKQAEYNQQQTLLEKLKGMDKAALRKALPVAYTDTQLNELLSEYDLAQQNLIKLKLDYNPDHPKFKSAQAAVDDLNGKIDDRVTGILLGLEAKVAYEKAYLGALQNDIVAAEQAQIHTTNEVLEAFARANDSALPKPAVPPPTPQPEILTRENAFSTFSLNVSDVSFKLAAASLEKGQLPEPASIRSEEFINAFDYRDPDAVPGVPIAFAAERARYPFAHNRELLRFSLKTAAAGRQAGRPLNIVLLLDNSGSMERADRVTIIREALRVLAKQLQASDTFSIVTFARTAQLRVDGVPGSQAAAAAEEIAKLTPEGGTNLGEALDLAYETALHHYLAKGDNRVVLLTDGAANLGDVNPDVLKQKVEAHRQQGVALDCFGIGWEGYNDDLLETLTRNGDGRYGFINTPEAADTDFVAQIAGALHVAAADVKVQVEFNTNRVTSYRQIGYAKHQLTKEQFRDNTVDAAEIAAQEAGNALYTIEINPQGEGSIATVRVRYKVPRTAEYREQAWDVPYTGGAVAMDQASPAMRLASTACGFSEWLATSPFAAEVSTEELLKYLNGVPQVYGADARPAKLEWMIRQAKSISGK